MQEYWVDGEGIDSHVIRAHIARFLGNGASVRSYSRGDRNGFMVKAHRSLTKAQVDDLKYATTRWRTERLRTGNREYTDSKTYTDSQKDQQQIPPPRFGGDSYGAGPSSSRTFQQASSSQRGDGVDMHGGGHSGSRDVHPPIAGRGPSERMNVNSAMRPEPSCGPPRAYVQDGRDYLAPAPAGPMYAEDSAMRDVPHGRTPTGLYASEPRYSSGYPPFPPDAFPGARGQGAGLVPVPLDQQGQRMPPGRSNVSAFASPMYPEPDLDRDGRMQRGERDYQWDPRDAPIPREGRDPRGSSRNLGQPVDSREPRIMRDQSDPRDIPGSRMQVDPQYSRDPREANDLRRDPREMMQNARYGPGDFPEPRNRGYPSPAPTQVEQMRDQGLMSPPPSRNAAPPPQGPYDPYARPVQQGYSQTFPAPERRYDPRDAQYGPGGGPPLTGPRDTQYGSPGQPPGPRDGQYGFSGQAPPDGRDHQRRRMR